MLERLFGKKRPEEQGRRMVLRKTSVTVVQTAAEQLNEEDPMYGFRVDVVVGKPGKMFDLKRQRHELGAKKVPIEEGYVGVEIFRAGSQTDLSPLWERSREIQEEE